MRVSRSLTIKQMSIVSTVSVITICIFIVIQLFHFVQQRRIDYAQQMENIAHTIRKPLTDAVSRGDLYRAQQILNGLAPAGMLARAEVRLPNAIPLLYGHFSPQKPVPALIMRLFHLPVQITVPLYATTQVPSPKPLARLVLQADSWRVYQFILSMLATMITAYLLLALVLSISISWCINRLIVHPLRDISQALYELSPQQTLTHRLSMPQHHHDDEIGALIRGYNRNQQALAASYDEMRCLSTHHPDTGLPNRTLFHALLKQRLCDETGKKTVFTIIVVRIETLREATLTREQREALVDVLIKRMRSVLDEQALLAQTDESDFSLLSNTITSPFRAVRLVRHLITTLNQPVMLPQRQLQPDVAIGITQCHGVNPGATELLNEATSAMMSARQQGKNQLMFFEPALTERMQQRLVQQNAILQGLKNGHFALFLQPQVNMLTGELTGAEALLRIRQPDGHYALPEDFITGAEEMDVMDTLGHWVIEEACRVLADWQKQGITLPLSVNVSALQLSETGIVAHLQAQLQKYAVAPGKLVLELTETAHINDINQAMTLLKALQALGITLVLDDFGMGYASLDSLQQLKSLPISKLKTDRSFVASLPADDTMVSIVVAIASILHLDVIAEGVETPLQRERLLSLGITLGQGHLYSEAIAIDQFNHLLLTAPANAFAVPLLTKQHG